MVRLLWFNLSTDANDPILGFTTRWIQALSPKVDSIDVITMRAGRIEVPENVRVHSVGKEKGYSEPRRAVEFYRYLFRILREEHIDACFSHMIPIFTLLAAPVLKTQGIPMVTWYAHRQVTTVLKLAHHLSNLVVSTNNYSYRYRHDKLIALGQGIDTSAFSPSPHGSAEGLQPLLLSAGRLSPIKDLLTFVQAVYLLRQRGYPVQAALVGATPERDLLYGERVKKEVEHLGLNSIVQFAGAVPQEEVVNWHRRGFAHVNLCPTGAIDKAALEAMACGRLSIASNEGFRETMGEYAPSLLFCHGNAEDLAEKIEALLGLSAAGRERIGLYLRERVLQMHSLERLADKLVALFHEARKGGR